MEENKDIYEVNINPLSYCAIPINLIFSETDTTLASGTAFFYKYENKIYIITNWHNVTGINPLTGELLNSNGGQPDIIEFPALKHKQPFVKWGRFGKKLYSDKELMKPNWYIHPIHGKNVDVVAIEVENINNIESLCINNQDFTDIPVIIADNVYILGFPYNVKGGGNFPIWKRGTIATEPDINIDNLPKILIDTASRPGMSGSPVIYKRNGIHNLVNGQIGLNSTIGRIQGFVGIYSGRILGKTELEAQLGIVWKKEVIEEIIKGQQLDSRENFHNTSQKETHD